jgi:hypothetical protein
MYKRSSGGRLLAAFPLADSASRDLGTYDAAPGAVTDHPSLLPDFDLNSRYNLGRVEFEAALLCYSFRRGFDVSQTAGAAAFTQTLSTRATVFTGGLRYPIPMGSWDLVLGAAAGYVRATADYSETLTGYGSVSGTLGDDGLVLEASLELEKFVSPQISLGPILRYRAARLSSFSGTNSYGAPVYLVEGDFGRGPEITVGSASALAAYPGLKKAVLDMGGLGLGLELQYHY